MVSVQHLVKFDRCAGMTQAEAAVQEPKNRKSKGAPAGALAYHAWVRQWRERTGGNLVEGRQAWKELDSKTKWQFKIEHTENISKTKASEAEGAVNHSKSSSSGSSVNKVRARKGAAKSMKMVQPGKRVHSEDHVKPQNGATPRSSMTSKATSRVTSSCKSAETGKPKSMKRA